MHPESSADGIHSGGCSWISLGFYSAFDGRIERPSGGVFGAAKPTWGIPTE